MTVSLRLLLQSAGAVAKSTVLGVINYGWRRGVVVTALVVSTKLPYVEPS